MIANTPDAETAPSGTRARGTACPGAGDAGRTEHTRMSLVELRDARRTYRRGRFPLSLLPGRAVRAVDGVSLAIESGSRLALVGASGSGKSTLGRLLLGRERPDGGAVLFHGRDWRSLRGEEQFRALRAVQTVPQNAFETVKPHFTAFDIIGEPLRNFDKMEDAPRRRRVEELLETVGLSTGDAAKKSLEFSWGELQRVCLARALATRPELLVLDEATSGLDTPAQTRILRLLEEIGEQTGCAYVLISHDLRAVRRFAASVAVMDGGRLVAYAADMNNPADAAGLHAAPAFRALADAAPQAFPLPVHSPVA